MSSLLVEWVKEPRTYSVLPSDNLVDGSLRANSSQLVGKVADVMFGKKSYSAKILQFGDACSLSLEADKLAELALKEENLANEGQKIKGRAKKKNGQAATADRLQNINFVLSYVDHSSQDEVENVLGSHQPSSSDAGILLESNIEEGSLLVDYEAKYRALKEKYKAKKARCKELRLENRNLLERSAANVEIYPGSGVYMNPEELASIKLLSMEPTILARNLFRRLFTLEEVSGQCLFGKKCNANKNVHSRPPVDAVRRNAIINYVLQEEGVAHDPPADYSVAEAKQYMKRKKYIQREVNKSLSAFMREEAKKGR
ncbi:putative BEN domain-containing protein B1 [Folsomia candida]|uniref:Putative BEN domain-containing protein B1 n=1 Tax=Folsomia candida TaxID=158441 RepID=A0A226DBV7_FOLCA|nr:putative BEN domain-containing protein B1 [Folsomia candida]